MYKRIAQFISILSLSMLLIGGVWTICIASIKNQRLDGFNCPHSVVHGNKTLKTTFFHWKNGRQLKHHIEDCAIEKPEESDVKSSKSTDGLSFPILADLLHKNIRFGLFSLLYNSKSIQVDPILLTCYDSERFIFLQHFRI